MANYQSVEQLNTLFKSGQVNDLPEEITISGIPYLLRDYISYPITEMIKQNLKGFVIYASSGGAKLTPEYKKLVSDGLLKEWVVFIWGIQPGLEIVPARAVTQTAARAQTDLKTATRELAEGQYITIADEESIKFSHFGKSVVGKVDTGANMSSIHAEGWKIIRGTKRVEIQASLLSQNKIIMNLEDQVVVKTSEGTEYRPVVAFDVEMKGKPIKQAKFNLNDRSSMAHPLLIGQNILEKGNFVVNPNIQKDHPQTEGVDWDALQEEYKDVHPDSSIKETRELYDMLLNSELSFQDLMRHLHDVSVEKS